MHRLDNGSFFCVTDICSYCSDSYEIMQCTSAQISKAWLLFLLREIIREIYLVLVSFLSRCTECRRGLAIRTLSVGLSVRRVNGDKTDEKSVQYFTSHERTFSLVFWEKEWLVEESPSTWNFGLTGSSRSEIADFWRIIARSASTVTPSKKVQLTLLGSPPRAFNEHHRMLPISPQRGAQKRKTATFRLKSHFAWRKSATKFLCLKTVSDKVVRHSVA